MPHLFCSEYTLMINRIVALLSHLWLQHRPDIFVNRVGTCGLIIRGTQRCLRAGKTRKPCVRAVLVPSKKKKKKGVYFLNTKCYVVHHKC